MEIDDHMFFSIIVPVYNVEDYLDECVKSILAQTYRDFEVILVDDGSPDRCPQICDIFKEMDTRVKVIHKENGGLSSARNAGLNEINGEYVVFVDSDDVIAKDALEHMRAALHQSPDVLITEYHSSPKCSLDNAPSTLFDMPSSNKKVDVISYVFYEKKNTWASVQYIINKNLIEKHHLRFEEGYYHEDVSWTGRVFLKAKTFNYDNKVWYIRRPDRTDSITNVVKPKRTVDTIELVSKQIHSSEYEQLTDAERKVMFNQYVRAVFSSLIHYGEYERADQLRIATMTKENIDIFDYALAKKHKAFVKLMKVVGVDCSLKLYCALFRGKGK